MSLLQVAFTEPVIEALQAELTEPPVNATESFGVAMTTGPGEPSVTARVVLPSPPSWNLVTGGINGLSPLGVRELIFDTITLGVLPCVEMGMTHRRP